MRFLFALCLVFAQGAYAAPPKTVTDIAPIHSLVAMVMGDLGEPYLLLSASSDPHFAALRPTQARHLQEAELIVAVGGGLTPWLESSLPTLAPKAIYLELMHNDATLVLEARENADFGDHDHDDHGHDDHGEDFDPHGWLDPENGRLWLGVIANALAELDPANAEAYASNARKSADQLGKMTKALSAKLAPHHDRAFVLFHDAFHYFETRFDLKAIAALSLSDSKDPGPKWVRTLQEKLEDHDVKCLFSQDGNNSKQLHILANGRDIEVKSLDPLGQRLTPGPELYPNLIRALADDISSCLNAK